MALHCTPFISYFSKLFHTIHIFQKLTGLVIGSRGQVTAVMPSNDAIPKVILCSLRITAISKGQMGRSYEESRRAQSAVLRA